jgi:hypothetical protein
MMSHEMLKLINKLKIHCPDKALKALNKTTGLAWASMPVSLANQAGNNTKANESTH